MSALRPSVLLAAAAMMLPETRAFSIPSHATSPRTATRTSSSATSPRNAAAAPSSPSSALHATTYRPVFDFTLANPVAKSKSASSFERIDDAIMGGISTSSLRDVPTESYASWSGVCRTDGGGFCGTRTLPFKHPLDAAGMSGVYLDCDLVSDDEAHRRVWKMTVRTDSSRGEMVYQAEYDLQRAMDDECDLRDAMDEAAEAEIELRNAMEEAEGESVDVAKEMGEAQDAGRGLQEAMAAAKRDGATPNGDDECWARVFVPFDDFRLVRGPRLVPDGPKLDLAGGIFQIGMTLSKFKMAQNTTELEDFRPGYFDMRIRQMGFYDNDGEEVEDASPSQRARDDVPSSNVPDTLTEKEAKKNKPLLLKMLLPVAKVFFSEKANRRRSAMRILREDRGLGRGKAILFGIRSRKRSMGTIPSVFKTLGILSVDAFRAVALSFLKVVLLYPLRAVGAVVRGTKQMLGMKVKPSLRE